MTDPQQRTDEPPLLTEAERCLQLSEWNDTAADYPRDRCVHHLFEEQAKQTPDAVAVEFGDRRLTYWELNARANQLAHHLREAGVGPEALVNICVERSLEMVVGLLGILKAGGAYVPMDPAHPAQRLRFLLEDSAPRLLLTQRHIRDRLSPAVATVCVDEDGDTLATQSTADPGSGVTASNLAYVIYTSGSTGQPKGVAVEHRSVSAFLSWSRTIFGGELGAAVLASTTVCFDLSVFEIFGPLSWGGRVVLVCDILTLLDRPSALRVTLINTVPSAARALLDKAALPQGVRAFNLAGEAFPPGLAAALAAFVPGSRVYNLYGPTETTTYSTFAEVDVAAAGPPPIGRPIANTRVYVLDTALQPMPTGVPGDLYIGGAGLARGYLNRPELTAERFVPDPFSAEPGSRLYRTGDRASWRADGNLEFLGRADDQVKLRGFRIELGEIEAALASHPQVREAVVLCREDEPGQKRLVAYLTPDAKTLKALPSASALQEHLMRTLPEYMVPAAFVTLPALPLTPNGKIDRRALPAPRFAQTGRASEPPLTPVEEAIADAWCVVLGVVCAGRHDNFFEHGGDSLRAAQLLARVRAAFEVEVSLAAIIRNPTVAGIAELIQHRAGQGVPQSPAKASS